MEIVAIFAPNLYSVKFDNREQNEYERLFGEWLDLEYLIDFMESNASYIDKSFWNNPNPESMAKQAKDEAFHYLKFFEKCTNNTANGDTPDLNELFIPLDGKYSFSYELYPVKSYGVNRPSLLRMYAIKMGENRFLITGGGIKLCKSIQESPYLKDHIIQDIDKTLSFLRENGIITTEDF